MPPVTTDLVQAHDSKVYSWAMRLRFGSVPITVKLYNIAFLMIE